MTNLRPDGKPWPDFSQHPPTEDVYIQLRDPELLAAADRADVKEFYRLMRKMRAGRPRCWPWQQHVRPPLYLRYWMWVGRGGHAHCLRCGRDVDFNLTQEEADRMIAEYYGK